MTDAGLLAIEPGPFITAVTGHPESLQRADEDHRRAAHLGDGAGNASVPPPQLRVVTP
jgi:hypothetical protein